MRHYYHPHCHLNLSFYYGGKFNRCGGRVTARSPHELLQPPVKLYESKWRWLAIPLGFVGIACGVTWLASGSTGLRDAASGVITGVVVVAILDFKRRGEHE